LLGKAALEQGRVAEAARWFERALEIGSDMAWLHTNVGGLYAQRERLDKAAALFEKARQLDPYFYEGPFGAGYVALRRAIYPDAITAFQQAVKAAPHRADGWYMLGVAYHEAGDTNGMKAAWARYLSLEPHGAMAETVGKKLQER
jgi:tetratricopeptide (TPR) repeat protein